MPPSRQWLDRVAPDRRDVADTTQVPQLVDHLFRREAGRMVAALTRVLGAESLSLAVSVCHVDAGEGQVIDFKRVTYSLLSTKS